LRKKLRQKIRQTGHSYWNLVRWFFMIMQDRISPSLWRMLWRITREVLPHPAYSPDISPPDYDLFPKLKNPLRGQRFPTLNALNAAVNRHIREINSRGDLNGIQHLPQRWEAVIQLQGDYFERSYCKWNLKIKCLLTTSLCALLLG
jgi:hypothetical protein